MKNIPTQDRLYHLTLLGGQARALIVDSTRLCERAREIHSSSRVAAAALGRMLTQAAMMGAMLKNEADSVTCAIKGGGPIGMMIAVADGRGTVKGYAENPHVDLPRVNEKLPVGDAVGTDGYLSVTRDLGLKEPYTGKVKLVSGEIAEDFAYYYALSEQTPSLVSLGVLVGDGVISAGGLILQTLPGADEDAISKVEALANRMKPVRETIQEFGLAGAVDELFKGLDPEIVLERDVSYRCDCSRARVEGALVSLGEAELSSMIEEGEDTRVDCHFCGKRYEFSPEALRILLKDSKDGGTHEAD